MDEPLVDAPKAPFVSLEQLELFELKKAIKARELLDALPTKK